MIEKFIFVFPDLKLIVNGDEIISEPDDSVKLQYKINNETEWTDYIINNVTRKLNVGDTIKFRGLTSTLSESNTKYYRFTRKLCYK